MRLYLATWSPEIKSSENSSFVGGDIQTKVFGELSKNMKLRILISYHYYKNTDLHEMFSKYFTEPYPDVFVDSGGFSAYTQGAEINIKEYADWIKRYKDLITVYANLDDIKSAEKTLKNQKLLEDMGLNPIPVFHTNEDWNYLENYIDNYSYIALGGMVPYLKFTKKIMPWIIEAFKIAKDEAVYHAFGATSWIVMNSFPWYSVDSSSWGAGFRYGRVPLFDEVQGKFKHISLGDKVSCKKHTKLIRKMGFEPEEFWNRDKNKRESICAISAISYMNAEKWVRKRWGEINIPNSDKKNGVKIYLSDTSNGTNYSDADKGMKVYLAGVKGVLRDVINGLKNNNE